MALTMTAFLTQSLLPSPLHTLSDLISSHDFVVSSTTRSHIHQHFILDILITTRTFCFLPSHLTLPTQSIFRLAAKGKRQPSIRFCWRCPNFILGSRHVFSSSSSYFHLLVASFSFPFSTTSTATHPPNRSPNLPLTQTPSTPSYNPPSSLSSLPAHTATARSATCSPTNVLYAVCSGASQLRRRP